MSGSSLLFLAAIGIPDARHLLLLVCPFLALAVAWWIWNHTDEFIHRLFPDWEWERQLGWFNIRAQKRAEAVFRWLGYGFYAVLTVALYGIVWGAQGLQDLGRWREPGVVEAVERHFGVFLVSLGVWLVYLGYSLLPKLRHQHESEELEKFRAQQDEQEKERESRSGPRFKPSRKAPRGDLPSRSRPMGPGQ